MKNTVGLSENQIKQAIKRYLITQGWNVETTRRTKHGLDVDATRVNEHWIITYNCVQSNNIAGSFASALGSAIHIMEDPKTKYSVALPDSVPFRRLWERLPFNAKKRAGITALFVDQMGLVIELVK